MRFYAFLSVLLLSTLWVAFFSATPVYAAPTWTIKTIDITSTGGGQIAIDSHNNPHIFYGHYENSSARSPIYSIYASWNGSNWNNQTVPDFGSVYNFVLDSSNNPHMLFDGSYNGLIYASWARSNWTLQTISKEDAIKGFLALDSTGNPQVTYTVNLPLSEYPPGVTNNIAVLKYANWNGSGWVAQTIDFPISYFNDVYLSLDSNDNPHIMYSNETLYFPPEGGYNSLANVKFATWNGAAWNIQTAFSDISYYGNMVLDSKGYPHFLYRQDYPISNSFNSTLSYASWNGSAWNTQIVISNAFLGDAGTAFLALDSYDYPHIDYINKTIGGDYISLVYAGWTGSAWDFQIVGPNSLAIYAGPIAMDSNGNAHIAYTGHPSSFRPFASPVYAMYATAPQPIYTPKPSPTQVPSSPFSTFASLIILTIVIIATVSILVYIVWKRKLRKH